MRVPAMIGRYPVTGLVGTGAFSAVYRAIDDRLGCEVAIKLLGDHHSLDPDIRERFIAEARLLRRLNSPNVVRLYELAETDRHQPYHVLELLPGGNLSTHRRLMTGRGLAVTTSDVATVASAVTAALTALHAERIVHRDLTPSNLLLRRGSSSEPVAGGGIVAEGESLVLADLGLSKDLAVSSGLTAAGGTDGFAAPEQRATGTVDERTDVFAASALLLWLLLGHPPTDGDSDADELALAGWPGSLGAALAAGLAENPACRPESIVAWHQATTTALQPPAPPPVPPAAPAPAPVAGPIRRPDRIDDAAIAPPRALRARRWALVAAGGAAAVAGAAGYGVAVLIDDDADAPAVTATDLGGGMVSVERSEAGATAGFDGPAALVVGETATFTARVEGAAAWVWVGPGGRVVVDDAEEIAVTPTSSGRLAISLIAFTPTGVSVVADATFPVAEP